MTSPAATKAMTTRTPASQIFGVSGMPRARGASSRSARPAFTLLELLVAVGASVLIALALAQLFKTTGDTVTKGRRAAYFNSYAAMIQRTLAQDFASMSRNGYMVIRHEVTNDGAVGGSPGGTIDQTLVPLYRGQPANLFRPRRIDELMFFVEGKFASAREAVHPDVVARSSQARVYYGIGTVSAPIPSGSPFAYGATGPYAGAVANPNVLGGRLGQPGSPNAFASDWILLRQQTLLTLPQAATRDFPTGDTIWGLSPTPPNGNARIRLEDKNRQIALQPAAASIFRVLNRPPQPLDLSGYPAQGGWRRPALILPNSGLIDIATTDLAEIRSYVMQSHTGGAPGSEQPIYPWTPPPTPTIVGITLPVPQSYVPRLPNAFLGNVPNAQTDMIFGMHAWMRNGMPTNSHADPFTPQAAASEATRTRIRCADFAANLPAILADQSLAASGKQMQRSDMISNERMLLASNLVPHCTEFVVEWSFGAVNQFTGQTLWYGTTVPRDPDGDGRPEALGYTYYDFNLANDPIVPYVFIDRTTGALTTDASQHPVDPRLIYGQTYDSVLQTGDPQPLVAHFGFTDPTYLPANAQQLPTLQWAWPSMVRITITLTDPSDTTIERSFQFVFKTPPAGRN